MVAGAAVATVATEIRAAASVAGAAVATAATELVGTATSASITVGGVAREPKVMIFELACFPKEPEGDGAVEAPGGGTGSGTSEDAGA